MTHRRPRVAALGDSVTLGVGDGVHTPDGTGGWAAHVATMVGASCLVNVAANGARARDLMSSQVPQALLSRPDIVLLSVGGNDVLRGDFSATEIETQVTLVLDRLERVGRSIVLVAPDAVALFDLLGKPLSRVMRRRVEATNRALHSACRGRAVHIIDGAQVVRSVGSHAWHVDRIHPSAVGHRALAIRAAQALQSRWPIVAQPRPAAPLPHLALRVAWLAVHGLPWLVKRSKDLVPQVMGVAWQEWREPQASSPR